MNQKKDSCTCHYIKSYEISFFEWSLVERKYLIQKQCVSLFFDLIILKLKQSYSYIVFDYNSFILNFAHVYDFENISLVWIKTDKKNLTKKN